VTSDIQWLDKAAAHLPHLQATTRDNPPVVCIIVDGSGNVSAVGKTHAVGWERPLIHAEADALTQAGEKARGATAYVTLEPCAKRRAGGTACAALLSEAGVKRVVIGAGDPHPNANGAGIEMLRQAEIEVTVLNHARSMTFYNTDFVYRLSHTKPYIIVKQAISADRYVGCRERGAVPITGKKTNVWAHENLRSRVNAIMVGAGTILADNPQLSVRHSDGARPDLLRIVMGKKPSRFLEAFHIADESLPTVFFSDKAAGEVSPLTASETIWEIGAGNSDAPLLNIGYIFEMLADSKVMHHINHFPINRLLIEGGPRVLESAFATGYINEYYEIRSPGSIGAHCNEPVGAFQPNLGAFSKEVLDFDSEDTITCYKRT